MRLEESFTRPIYSDLKPVNLDPNESNEKQDMNLVLRAEKAESRVEALEQEISKIVKTFAQQVVELKVKLAEKESYQRSFGRSGTSR